MRKTAAPRPSRKQWQKRAMALKDAMARAALVSIVPDMVIVDISLGGDDSLDLVREIATGDRPAPTLVLSIHDETVWAERAIRTGARGYIMKKAVSESVIHAIRAILNGHIHRCNHFG